MEAYNVKKIIFSSSASVYGALENMPVNENLICNPGNPYAKSKLDIEKILLNLAKIEKNWSIVILRYFNPIGAHTSDFYFGNPVANSLVICKASSIQKFSFNESSAYIAVEDFDLWIRMCSKKFLFVKLDFPLLLYRRSPKQISVNKFKMIKKSFLLYTNIFGRLRAFLFTILYIISSFFRIIKRSM
jgi:hypothetical protein